MERIIKFRGKRKDNGEWVYGNLIYINEDNVTKFKHVPKSVFRTRYYICSQLEIDIVPEGYADSGNEKLDFLVDEVIPSSVGQFTGHHDSTTWDEAPESEKKRWIADGHTEKDWKGIEVYEGDIISGLRDGELDYSAVKSTVIFKEGAFIDSYFGYALSSFTNVSYGYGNVIKVIGNTADNPELAKEGI